MENRSDNCTTTSPNPVALSTSLPPLFWVGTGKLLLRQSIDAITSIDGNATLAIQVDQPPINPEKRPWLKSGICVCEPEVLIKAPSSANTSDKAKAITLPRSQLGRVVRGEYPAGANRAGNHSYYHPEQRQISVPRRLRTIMRYHR